MSDLFPAKKEKDESFKLVCPGVEDVFFSAGAYKQAISLAEIGSRMTRATVKVYRGGVLIGSASKGNYKPERG